MSNKHSNRPSGCPGHPNGHCSRGDRNQTHTPNNPGTFKDRAADLLTKMQREMGAASKEIGQTIVDVMVPLIVASALLPDMDLRINGLRVSHNSRRTFISFQHPNADDEDKDDYDEHLCGYED